MVYGWISYVQLQLGARAEVDETEGTKVQAGVGDVVGIFAGDGVEDGVRLPGICRRRSLFKMDL